MIMMVMMTMMMIMTTMMMMMRTVNLKRVHFSGNLSAQDCAGLSCCGNDGSFDVSGLVPRASHTFVRKKIKKACPRNKNWASATFVSIKICYSTLNLFSVQIHSNMKSTFNPTISISPVAIYRHQFLSISFNVSWILFPPFMITCISLIERSKI